MISKRLVRAACVWIVAASLSAPLVGHAAGADFHALFETRCLRCHGHAGDFAREHLKLEKGTVLGRDGRDIEQFLERHAGGLSAEEAALFVSVFAQQVASGGFYKDHCEICHDSARELARLRLIIRDDRLVGRYTDRDIASFLTQHGRMNEAEAAAMTKALTAILQGAR